MLDPDHGTISIGRLDITKPFSTTLLGPIPTAARSVICVRTSIGQIRTELGSFPVAFLAGGQQSCRRIGDNHPDDFITISQRNTFDTAGVSSHRSGVRLAEADRHSLHGRKHNFITSFGDHNIDDLVVFTQLDRNDPALARTSVLRQSRFLDQALLRRHQQKMVLSVKVPDRPTRRNRFTIGQRNQIHNRTATTLTRKRRQLMDL